MISQFWDRSLFFCGWIGRCEPSSYHNNEAAIIRYDIIWPWSIHILTGMRDIRLMYVVYAWDHGARIDLYLFFGSWRLLLRSLAGLLGVGRNRESSITIQLIYLTLASENMYETEIDIILCFPQHREIQHTTSKHNRKQTATIWQFTTSMDLPPVDESYTDFP